MDNNIISNINSNTGFNYQLLKNHIIDIETNRQIIYFSILINKLSKNCVIKSVYICDVSRDIISAKRIFNRISECNTECETVNEIISEMI